MWLSLEKKGRKGLVEFNVFVALKLPFLMTLGRVRG